MKIPDEDDQAHQSIAESYSHIITRFRSECTQLGGQAHQLDIDSFMSEVPKSDHRLLRAFLAGIQERQARPRHSDEKAARGRTEELGPITVATACDIKLSGPAEDQSANGTETIESDESEEAEAAPTQTGHTGATVHHEPSHDSNSLPHTECLEHPEDRTPEVSPYATTDFIPGQVKEAVESALADRVPNVHGYQIDGELGRGAMGVVYRARQVGLNRTVALKMVLTGSHASERELARFQAEAEAVALLHHSNIVQIYEVGQHDQLPYFSLEFVDGEPLDRTLGSKPLPDAEAARLTETIARAMHYAHQRGVVHRDLKPQNVMMTSDGIPKVTDFGLAKRLESDSHQTKTGTIMGTPSYMAPEQANGKIDEIGPLTDVYSIGAMLYEFLTGNPPFMGATALDTVMLVANEEPTLPSRLRPDVHADLETICLKCLQKDSDKRYASAHDLAEDLKRFSAGEPILARPISKAEVFLRWCRRNPWIASLSALVAVLLVAVALVSTVAALAFNRQRIIAEDNADSARKAEAAAELNAKRAERAKSEALKARALADERAEVATAQAGLALDAYQTLIDEVQRELVDRPNVQDVRETLLKIAVEKLTAVARSANTANLIDKEMAKAHQKLGRLFENLGQGGLALEQYKQASTIVLELAGDQQDNPIESKRNPSGLINNLGDMCVRMGQLAQAEEYYRKALDLRLEWIAMETEERKKIPAKLAVSASYGLLGHVELLRGRPALAQERYLQLVEWLKQVPEQYRRNPILVERWANADRWLAVTEAKLGQLMSARERLESSGTAWTRLVQSDRNSTHFALELAKAHYYLAQFQLEALGEIEAAQSEAAKGLKILDRLAVEDPRNALVQQAVVQAQYLLGQAELLLGNKEQSKISFQDALDTCERLVRLNPGEVESQTVLMRVLARAGLFDRSTAMADDFVTRYVDNPWVLVNCGAAYALRAAANAEKNGDVQSPSPDARYFSRALASIKDAIERGWNDAATLRQLPEFAELRADPGFQELLARLEE